MAPGSKLILAKARDPWNVPRGRTEVSDAGWLRQLHSYGLLCGWFRHEAEIAKDIHDPGLIGILRDLHDQSGAALAQAQGWPADLTNDQILHNLAALNRDRAAKETKDQIRRLHPDCQNLAAPQSPHRLVSPLLESPTALGQTHRVKDGHFAA